MIWVFSRAGLSPAWALNADERICAKQLTKGQGEVAGDGTAVFTKRAACANGLKSAAHRCGDVSNSTDPCQHNRRHL